MKLTDILPLEQWVALETEIHQKFGVDTNVFNTDGVRISEFKEWVNRLCPAIKATDKGQSFICAVAHMNLAVQARNTRQAVIEECDAGLFKLVVPIIINEEFLGAIGACGMLLDDGEADSFLINKITDIDEDQVELLASDLAQMSSESAQALSQFIESKISAIVAQFETDSSV
ncbi:PocR ligand-binding domain-containing protein [Thermodesulfobacteriota bacterium]